MLKQNTDHCKYCGGLKSQRNPTGRCDHLYWPDNLSDEAKEANGYRKAEKRAWEKINE